MAIRSTPEIPVRPSEPSEFHVGSRLRPIHYWSAFGAACVAIQVYVYGSWLLSGDVYPQRTGSDPVPLGVQAAAWIMQATSILAVVALIVYVWRRSRREHALAWDALIAIGFAAAYWQDPIINYFRPVYFYNSYLINVGAWTSHIPGWLSPHAGNLPEPLFMILPIFTCLFVVFGIAFCAMARRVRRIWPDIGQVGLFVIGVLVFGIFNIFMEAVFLQTRLFVYAGVVNPLSLFAGHSYQFPLYEAVVAGINSSVVGMVRLTRDRNGQSAIERGADELSAGKRAKTLARVLAFVGLGNAVLVFTNVVYIAFGLHVDQMPQYPSYLKNDICGTEISPPCPGPGVPISLDNKPHRAGPR